MYRSIISLLCFFTFIYSYSWGQSIGPDRLKATYGITDIQVGEYMESLSKEGYKYKYLIQLKLEDPDKFRQAVAASILSGAVKQNTVLTNEIFSNSVKQLKSLYKISENDIENYLIELENNDPEAYSSLMNFKKENASQVDFMIVQEIGTQSGDTQLQSVRSEALESLITRQKIKTKVEDFRKATSDNAKKRIRNALKLLVSEDYDHYLKTLDSYVENLEESVEKAINSRKKSIVNRDQEIERRLNLYLSAN